MLTLLYYRFQIPHSNVYGGLQAQRRRLHLRRLPAQRHDLRQLSQDAGLQLARGAQEEVGSCHQGGSGGFSPVLDLIFNTQHERGGRNVGDMRDKERGYERKNTEHEGPKDKNNSPRRPGVPPQISMLPTPLPITPCIAPAFLFPWWSTIRFAACLLAVFSLNKRFRAVLTTGLGTDGTCYGSGVFWRRGHRRQHRHRY